MSSNILLLSLEEFMTSCITFGDIKGSSVSSFLLLLGLPDIQALKEQSSVFFAFAIMVLLVQSLIT